MSRSAAATLAIPVSTSGKLSMENLRDDQLVDDNTVAAVIGMSVTTIRKWRYLAQGPPWVKVGLKSVRYRVGALREWLHGLEGQPRS
jgi:predicted DNA-binding transcriptional regulator AlpA